MAAYIYLVIRGYGYYLYSNILCGNYNLVKVKQLLHINIIKVVCKAEKVQTSMQMMIYCSQEGRQARHYTCVDLCVEEQRGVCH